MRVRGANTPEMRGQCQAEKDKARQAKQFTVAKLRGAQSIRLEHLGRDKYFRIDSNVVVDGRDLGQMLIGAGLARPYDGGTRKSWCR
nr:thermonuclease family protein [Salinisphaera japonica]